MAPSSSSIVAPQIAGIVGGLALLALAPPASGRFLLLPATRAAEARMLPLALDRGARLIGPGPLTGSYVVAGERTALLGRLTRAGILMIAAPAAGCGSAGARA